MAAAQNNTCATYYKAENAARVAIDYQAAWSVQGPNAASHAAASVYLSKTPAWNIGEPTLADILDQRDEALDALRELLTDMVIAQGNMRDAAKRDTRWEGCAEAIQPRVDAARAIIAKYIGEAA